MSENSSNTYDQDCEYYLVYTTFEDFPSIYPLKPEQVRSVLAVDTKVTFFNNAKFINVGWVM